MRIVITGGHHSSAMPVIQALREKYPDIELFWFGHRHSLKGNSSDTLEYKEITQLGIPFYELKAGKFYRTYDILRLLKIPYGFFQALLLLIKIKPELILSFGGYLAVPVVIAGWLLKIPSITHEQTVAAGYANKLISLFARKVMISWEKSKIYYPASKVALTGLPLRKSIFEVKSNDFVFDNNLPVIYITGGKTGSHNINVFIRSVLPRLLNIANVIHQCGDHPLTKDLEILLEDGKNLSLTTPGKYYPIKFVSDSQIGEVYSKASLIISRSGAHTVAEIQALGKYAVFIPLKYASHNEQYLNALTLKDKGCAEILDEYDLNPEVFVETVNNLLRKQSEIPLNSIGYSDNAVKAITNEVAKFIK